MAPNDKAGRVVFIGNIPYGITEEQIIELFGRVGHVLGFRLVHDKETGRPKGFGFAEFADADAAASAVRNLNDHEMMGRKLRVDWSNDNGSGDNAPSASAVPAPPNGQQLPPPAQQSSGLDQLPAGTDIPPNITATDAISRTLSTLPPSQLLDILSQMKGVVMTDPGKAVDLLRRAPQLAYALFQSLLLLNLVQPDMLGQFIEPASAAPAAAPQQPPPVAQQPPRNYPGYPPQQAPTPVQAPPPQPQPPQPQAYAQPGLPPQVQAQLAQLPPEQQAQYATILALTPDQIAPLPPDQKSTIMQIRQVFGVR